MISFAVARVVLPLAILHAALAASSVPTANEIVARSIDANDRNTERSRQYVFSTRIEKRELDAAGMVKSSEAKTWEVVPIDGHYFRKLIAINDKPLPPEEARKEQERLGKAVAARQKESSVQKAKREAERKEKQQKEKNFNREILDAFDFRFAGDERAAGRDCWTVDATPKPGYKPKELRAQMLPHVKGRLWIDKQEFQWAKIDAEVIDPFSLAIGMAKVEKGTRFTIEQTRLDDGVWVPRTEHVRVSGRLALIKRIALDEQIEHRDYQKVVDR